jgi:hypothetical protein
MAAFEYQRINKKGDRTGGFYLEHDDESHTWKITSGSIKDKFPKVYSITTAKEWEKFLVIKETTAMNEWQELPKDDNDDQLDRVWGFDCDTEQGFGEFFGVGCDHKLKTIATIVPGLAKIEELIKACDLELDGKYAKEEPNPHENILKAIEERKVQAEAGDIDAMCARGLDLLMAPPQYRNYEEGMRWLKKAEDAGLALATYNIGVILRDGYSGERDVVGALKCFERAAQGEYLVAFRNAGLMYFNGQGCVKNQKKGYEWLFRAAQKGDYPSLIIIAKLYFGGAYVTQSDVEGTAWLLIAHKVGLLEGSIELAGLRTRLSAKELEKLLEKAEVRVESLVKELDEK